MIKLSLILPVYNVSKYIERCLNSICCQNREDIEIIIVDDESPDDSIEKVQKYCNIHSNIRIIHQKNKGLGGARNTGIREANGDYIWFIDSDDEIYANILGKIIEKINGEEIIIFDYSKQNTTDSISYLLKGSTPFSHLSGPEAEKHFILGPVWRNLYKSSYLKQHSIFFQEHFLHEDGEFNMRAMCFAKDVTYYPIHIYKYYTNNDKSIMNNIKIKNIQDLLSYIDSMLLIKKQYPSLSYEQKELLTNHVLVALSTMYKSMPILKMQERKIFRQILKKRRIIIKKIISQWNTNSYNKLKAYIQLYMPYTYIYNLIYYKHLQVNFKTAFNEQAFI